MNVSSSNNNNDSLARMKLKNSMREVLRLGKNDDKKSKAQPPPPIMEKDSATPKAAADAGGHDFRKIGELH